MAPTGETTGQNRFRCSNCGTEIQERAESCPECGTRQSTPSGSSDDKSVLGAILSVPVPGLGQIVNRQFGRGLAFMVAFYGGFFLFNTILGFVGLFDLLFFGVWGYAIYDAYVKGWESDEQEPARVSGATGGTATGAKNETTGGPGTTNSSTSGGTTDDLSGGESDRNDPVEPATADVTTESTATADSSMADHGTVGDTTGEEVTADGSATARSGDETATESREVGDSTATDDAVDDGEEGDVSIGNGDSNEEEENDGSNWSRDGSDHSWGSD